MSFSLYGALPPSKSGKETDHIKSESTSTGGLSGLYSSLPAPESGSTNFKKESIPTAPTTSATTPTAPTTAASSTSTTPAGWSAFNKFRPVLRRPTIQAKPKLNKPFIPTGATIVSTKTITKEERESELQQANQRAAQETSAKPTNDNIDLGAIPLLTSADDVNGFRATQKSKKKGKKGKHINANNVPQPVIFNMLEEYDPHRPNDYEQYKEERKELREKQKRQRDWEKKHQGRETSRSKSRSRSRSPASYYDSRSPSPEAVYHRDSYRSLSPPPAQESTLKINVQETADEAYKRRMMMSQQQLPSPAPPVAETPRPRVQESHPAHDVARKMLAKYGLQEGQGKESTKEQAEPLGRGLEPIMTSQVILLTNMVGPGEVDDMLQEETADECSKYGKVERCLIFEVPKGKISDDRAVRIFVKFSEIGSAQRAINDLNGRFFGGRIVTASFFDSKRFERLDLAPVKEEFY